MPGKRVAVALSGGVDSSVAAFLLKQEGYDVFGLMMKLWPSPATESSGKANWNFPEIDTRSAEAVSDMLGIPLQIIDLSSQFHENVIEPFCAEYENGRTPNPCIRCNRTIKFGSLMDYALSQGTDYLATGHYAGILPIGGDYSLTKGKDTRKDQSYMLFSLNQTQLSHTLFPLCSYTKIQVRNLARNIGLPSAEKAGSQDACFIQSNYRDFIREHVTCQPGNIVNNQGVVVGEHRGIPFYTVGQRHGLGISSGKPCYVTKMDAANNLIIVGPAEELNSTEVTASDLFWIAGHVPLERIEIRAKIRYKSADAEATILMMGAKANIVFREPQRAATPGQAVVFYNENKVIGGGTIEETK
ncbi:MAG: tRNA 2-thiouridine(34) synthase MnmA [Dehalococcoidia bacterium]|nr:tRNA 2-thiouridine(34) synthase MnmA [Dehalococcoidia bacterium]MDD5494029.1 tRNA 2-thiouridine(34) synthase MnmA [Dehalococcoidia bacterium]